MSIPPFANSKHSKPMELESPQVVAARFAIWIAVPAIVAAVLVGAFIAWVLS